MPTFVEEMGGKFFLLGPLVIEIGGGKKFLPTHFLPFPPSLIVVRSTALGRREPIIFSLRILIFLNFIQENVSLCPHTYGVIYTPSVSKYLWLLTFCYNNHHSSCLKNYCKYVKDKSS
jgi:hypothetical protein